MQPGNLMIVQGGGPTAVFNISLAEIIAEAQRQPRIGRILGSRVGIKGLLSGEVAELTHLAEADLDRLRRTPGAALGSSRYQPSAADLELLTKTLLQFEVEFLIFLGGNGTMRGAEVISQYLKSRNIDMHIVGVPKTVDNDIMETDRCPGYASAARYIATSTREVAADVSSLPQPVTIIETMGRSVGWLAAASLLAQPSGQSSAQGAPHLICLPETPFDLETFLDTLDNVVRIHKWAVVVVAEGLIDVEGKRVFEINIASQADGLKRPMIGGVAQHLATIVSERLRFRCRNEKPGLLGRASIALAAAQDRVDAALVGCAGIHALLTGDRDMMVALEPLSSGSASGYRLVPLDQVGGHVRQIPAEWISPGALPVGSAFRDYLEPMVGPLDEHFTGLPRAVAAERVEFH